NCDVIIQVGEGQNMKKFFAHSLILGARSTCFKAALSNNLNETQLFNLLIATDELNHNGFYSKLYDNESKLEDILHEIVPHVRWFQNSTERFWMKISPFEPIFPKKLYKDVIGYHYYTDTSSNTLILPQRRSLSFNSVLILMNHLLMISCWIDKKEKIFFGPRNIPYSFKLLYPYIAMVTNNCQQQQKFRSDIGPAFGGGCDLFIRGDRIRNRGFNTYHAVNIIMDNAEIILEYYEIFQVMEK
ncbi:13556_t:CDS:2, partial [Funneliformis geosporum]